jgi:hypothetical protein
VTTADFDGRGATRSWGIDMTTTTDAAATTKSAWPTRKWWATQVTALATLLVAWVTADHWDKTLTIGLIGLLTQAAVGYLIPNQDTPGGVPLK